MYKAALLDRKQQEDIDSFNKLLGKYQEVLDPTVKDKRTSLQEQFDDMASIFAPGAKFEMRAEETDRPRGLSKKK